MGAETSCATCDVTHGKREASRPSINNMADPKPMQQPPQHHQQKYVQIQPQPQPPLRMQSSISNSVHSMNHNINHTINHNQMPYNRQNSQQSMYRQYTAMPANNNTHQYNINTNVISTNVNTNKRRNSNAIRVRNARRNRRRLGSLDTLTPMESPQLQSSPSSSEEYSLHHNLFRMKSGDRWDNGELAQTMSQMEHYRALLESIKWLEDKLVSKGKLTLSETQEYMKLKLRLLKIQEKDNQKYEKNKNKNKFGKKHSRNSGERGNNGNYNYNGRCTRLHAPYNRSFECGSTTDCSMTSLTTDVDFDKSDLSDSFVATDDMKNAFSMEFAAAMADIENAKNNAKNKNMDKNKDENNNSKSEIAKNAETTKAKEAKEATAGETAGSVLGKFNDQKDYLDPSGNMSLVTIESGKSVEFSDKNDHRIDHDSSRKAHTIDI